MPIDEQSAKRLSVQRSESFRGRAPGSIASLSRWKIVAVSCRCSELLKLRFDGVVIRRSGARCSERFDRGSFISMDFRPSNFIHAEGFRREASSQHDCASHCLDVDSCDRFDSVPSFFRS